MYFGNASGLSNIMVIVILEVLLLVDSVALTVTSQRKVVKIVNILLAVVWVVCIVMNIISYGLL
jgi:hypothetical protein